jgi:hypothetical protein
VAQTLSSVYCKGLNPRSVSGIFTVKLCVTLYNEKSLLLIMSRVSSGSIVSGYGLDDRANGVRSPAGAKNLSYSLCVQTGSGAHPASCIMGTGGPFLGAKARPGRDADHSPLSNAEYE